VVTGVAAVRILTTQPDFNNVVEPTVLIDFPGIQVAVVVTQGHFGCIVMVQVLRGGSFENKIAVIKSFHKILHGVSRTTSFFHISLILL
jgi:hypothetical protein